MREPYIVTVQTCGEPVEITTVLTEDEARAVAGLCSMVSAASPDPCHPRMSVRMATTLEIADVSA